MLGLIRGRGQELVRGRGQEGGAVAVIVGLVVAMFVLTGVAALAIDGGSIYTQRRAAQNGADAASLALAQICAKDLTDTRCADTAAVRADLKGLASANAGSGNPPSIFEICAGGADALTKFNACPTPAGTALTDCPIWPASLPSDANWVAVKTRIFVPRVFAGLGDGTYAGKTVQACARAAWGPLTQEVIKLPFTIGTCEYTHATGVPIPATTDQIAAGHYGTETALGFNYNNTAACASWNGHDFPGGFGWTDRQPDCTAATLVGGWLGSVTPVSNGIGGGNSCETQLKSFIGKDVNLPIFDCVNANKIFCPAGHSTSSTWYHVATYALFHITALDVTGQVNTGTTNPPGTPSQAAKDYCALVTNDNKCIYGYFKKGVSLEGDMGGAGTSGLTKVVRVAG
jgi:hypothetical protein